MKKWLRLSESERKYKKPILRVGQFEKKADGTVFEFTKEHLDYFARSFSNKVPVPLEHTTEPDKNRGWVTGMEVQDDILYGVFELSEMIEDPSIYDTSVYIPIEEGRAQPIEHVALTSYPVVDGLGKFEAVACSLIPPEKEEDSVSFDWKTLGTALGLSDLTEENAVEKLSDCFKQQNDKVKNLELKLSEADPPTINIEQIKKKHGKLFGFAKDGKKAKIESLPLSKAVKDKLIEYYCSDEVIALSLSEDHVDDFDVVMEALAENEPLEFDEQSGAQLSQLPDGRKPKESGLVAMARSRAEAAKGGK